MKGDVRGLMGTGKNKKNRILVAQKKVTIGEKEMEVIKRGNFQEIFELIFPTLEEKTDFFDTLFSGKVGED